jgi:hypothetical protein
MYSPKIKMISHLYAVTDCLQVSVQKYPFMHYNKIMNRWQSKNIYLKLITLYANDAKLMGQL